MAQILVRDLDPDVVAKLKSRAQLNRRSLQSEVKLILEDATGSAAWLREAAEFAARMREESRGRVHTDSADLVREDRDR